MTDTKGIDTLRQMREQAEHLPAPHWPNDSDGGGEGAEDSDTLPDDCPVKPLGLSGDTYYYLDEVKQLRALAAKDHSRLQLQSLFGKDDQFYYARWPRLTQNKETKKWETTGWKPELAAQELMKACAIRGPWSPFEKVRGRGAWLGDKGELILHCGDRVLIVSKDPDDDAPWQHEAPGLIGGRIYPTDAAVLRPKREPQPSGLKSPGDRLLTLFATWHWRRPELDPYLLLGWCCAAMLGGALHWRPLAWVTGGFGTGKSTLQDALKWLFGSEGILQSRDATAAGVRQTVKHASLPVALDETEAEEDNRKMNVLVKLARDAASGSLSVRGGSDHEASSFTVRSCFLFSSILIPPLLPQDRSRIAVLELKQLAAGAARPKITVEGMRKLGAKLLRRLVQQWARWDDTFNVYRDMLARAGYDARGQDVFGTLLACADLALHDEAPQGEILEGWEEKLRAIATNESDGTADDSRACLAHLTTSALENPNDRKRATVGWWILRAYGHKDVYAKDEEASAGAIKIAGMVLETIGVKLRRDNDVTYVAVANMHAGLARIFAGTQWGGRPGADGVWKQSLQRLCETREQINKPVYFAGYTSRATLVPIELCLPSPRQAATPGQSAAASPAGGDGRAAEDAALRAGAEAGERSAADASFEPSAAPPGPGLEGPFP